MVATQTFAAGKSTEYDDLIKKRVDPKSMRAERYAMEESWLRMMKAYVGRFDTSFLDGQFVDIDLGDDGFGLELDYNGNITRPLIMRSVSTVMAANVKFDAMPQSPKMKHLRIAQLTKQVFHHLRAVTGYDDTTSLSATLWAAICGSAFLKCWWDPLAGEADRYYVESKSSRRVVADAYLDPQVRLEMDRAGLFEDYHQGEISIDVVNPFSFYHDWSARDAGIKACQWVAEKHWVDIDIAAERLGIDESELTPDRENQGVRNYEDALAFMASSRFMGPYNWLEPMDKRGKRVMWVDMWQRPSRKHPKGLRIVWAGGGVRKAGDNPNIADKSGLLHLPFVKQDWSPQPGRFWGSGLAEDLGPLNWHFNKGRSAEATFLNIHGAPATFIDSSSGVPAQNFSVRAGRTYQIAHNSSPVQYGPTPQLPSEVIQFPETVYRDMRVIASQGDSVQGNLPGQVRTGAGFEAINRERHLPLSIPAKQWAICTRDLGRMGLTYVQLNYKEPRMLSLIGADGKLAVREFTGADISNDIVIVGEPSVSDTREARRAEVLDAVQIGALQPAQNPDHARWVAEELHFGTDGDAVRKLIAPEMREELILDHIRENPQYFPVMDWEDHDAGAMTVQRYMMSPEFDQLDPRTQAAIAVRWNEHRKFIQSAQMQMAALMQMQGGKSGQKGPASQAPRG